MKTYQGTLQAKGLKIGIVVSRFNQFISERLLEGALDALHKLGAADTDISPSGQQLQAVATAMSRERLRRARIVMEHLRRYAPDAVMSPPGAAGLAIPV